MSSTKNLIRYGKTKQDRSRAEWLRVFDVPKRWFWHFYAVSAFWSGSLLFFYVNSILQHHPLPSFLTWFLSVLIGGKHSTESERDVPQMTTLLLLLMLWVHSVRRLLECHFVSVFSDGVIHVVQYIFGLCFYIVLGLTAFSFEHIAQRDSRRLFSQVNCYHLAGCGVFVSASVLQHQSLVLLANLRTGKSGDVVTMAHKMPRGGVFELVDGRASCWALFAVVSLLLVAVSAIPEENKPAQDQLLQQKVPTVHPIGPVSTEDDTKKGNLGFIHAFVASLSVIIVSELGDKTFFIAAIMAMRYNRLTVLTGAMLALAVMTCLSVLFGYATTIIPRIYTYYVSTALFAIFGIRMLREGLKMSPDEGQEELEEVQAEIKKKDEELQRSKLVNGAPDVEAGTTLPQKSWHSIISPIFIQAFTLTFLAEWGDRSQLTTIILAAREDPFGVAVGGTFGHCLCTGLAVIGGRMIAQKISVRTVTIIGGIVFLAFALSALFIKPDTSL
uniref:GDT1 family protein n=1 Tax=Knipowitschia caucasica TaxID=637954 RepID=A0AAV2KSD2_KNICA